jgi:hypothetical protein
MRSMIVVLALLLGLASFALGEDRAPAAAAPAPHEVVAGIMKALRGNNGPLRPGLPKKQAIAASPGAAKHIDTWYLPLAGSWLDPERRLQGTIDWDLDLDTETKLDCLRVVITTGPLDRRQMASTIVATGRSIGMTLDNDEEDPFTWFDGDAEGIELWISVGDGIVIVEAEIADGPEPD